MAHLSLTRCSVAIESHTIYLSCDNQTTSASLEAFSLLIVDAVVFNVVDSLCESSTVIVLIPGIAFYVPGG